MDENTHAKYQAIEHLLKCEKTHEALHQGMQLLASQPNHPAVLALVARCFNAVGHYKDAIKLTTQAISLAPHCAYYQLLLGHFLSGLRRV